jgi:tRNA threonylcarbamoyladenosine modification (KEOPS) complex  Pcc1 subunit
VTRTDAAWTAVVSATVSSAPLADWLERALSPEAAREVPRATARLRRAGDRTLELEVDARDAGAMRAALNTYLGWIGLAVTTSTVAGDRSRAPSALP